MQAPPPAHGLDSVCLEVFLCAASGKRRQSTEVWTAAQHRRIIDPDADPGHSRPVLLFFAFSHFGSLGVVQPGSKEFLLF